jgi:hypothetical protein
MTSTRIFVVRFKYYVAHHVALIQMNDPFRHCDCVVHRTNYQTALQALVTRGLRRH